MEEREVSFSDMLFSALRKWRKAIVFAVVCAILVGAFGAVTRVIDMNDPDKLEQWQTEYEIAHGSYWAAINEFDRKISANEILLKNSAHESSAFTSMIVMFIPLSASTSCIVSRSIGVI
jgi:hypothetical protein